MPSFRRQRPEVKSLLQRGLAEVGKTGKLLLTPEGKRYLIEIHGLSRSELARVAMELSKHPRELLHGGYKYRPRAYRAVLSFLNAYFRHGGLRGKRILELGYGGCAFLIELQKLGAYVAGLGEKPSARAQEMAKQLNLKEGKIEDVEKYFPGEMFDVIVTANLLESGSGLQGFRPLPSGDYDNYSGEPSPQRLAVMDLIHKKLVPGGVVIIKTMIGHGFLTIIPNELAEIEKKFDIVLRETRVRTGGYLFVLRKK